MPSTTTTTTSLLSQSAFRHVLTTSAQSACISAEQAITGLRAKNTGQAIDSDREALNTVDNAIQQGESLIRLREVMTSLLALAVHQQILVQIARHWTALSGSDNRVISRVEAACRQ